MSGIKGGVYFSRVKEAREAFKERAKEFVDLYVATIQEARIAGDYQTATKSLQWAMEHMPEEDGDRMIDANVDKPKQVEAGPSAPPIMIGFNLGGMGGTRLPVVETEEIKPAEVVKPKELTDAKDEEDSQS